LGADEFTDSTGAKNTIDTTASTGIWETSYYILGINDEASGDTTSDPDSTTTPTNCFDGDDSTAATKLTVGADATYTLGKTFGAKTVSRVKVVARGIARDTATGSGTRGAEVIIKLQKYNGSTWSDVGTIYSNTNSYTSWPFSRDSGVQEQIFDVDSSIQGLRISVKCLAAGTDSHDYYFYTLEYETEYPASSTVETNTIINEIVPDSIVVYGKTDLPTDTSITVDVSDNGGTSFTVTGQELGTSIDVSSFSTGNLALKFNLATTDTDVTPKLYGYGVVINQ